MGNISRQSWLSNLSEFIEFLFQFSGCLRVRLLFYYCPSLLLKQVLKCLLSNLDTMTAVYFWLLKQWILNVYIIIQGYELRVVNGRHDNEGRVEIKLASGDADWGVICGDHWTMLEARVACRQAGLGLAKAAISVRNIVGFVTEWCCKSSLVL